MEAGAFALSGVGALPNVDVAFPGEHWSDRVASGAITPGAAIVPAAPNAQGRGRFKVAGSGDSALQLAIAMRTVQPPDPTGVLGPNEIMNTEIANGEYVHAHYSGGYHLTLVVPDDYAVGDLVGWDANGARPTGKTGVGAWAKNADADIDSIFEVMLWRPVNDDDEGILTVRWVSKSQS